MESILAPYELIFLKEDLLIKDKENIYIPYQQIIYLQMKIFERKNGRWSLAVKSCCHPKPEARGYIVIKEKKGDLYEIHFPRYTGTPKLPGEVYLLLKSYCTHNYRGSTGNNPLCIDSMKGGSQMKNLSYPMVYLLLGRSEADHLIGYVTNSQFVEYHYFYGILNMMQIVSNLLSKSLYFQEEPIGLTEYPTLPKLNSHKLFVVEILYQQNHEWQGYIRGISPYSKCTFRNRDEMKTKIMMEMEKHHYFRKT